VPRRAARLDASAVHRMVSSHIVRKETKETKEAKESTDAGGIPGYSGMDQGPMMHSRQISDDFRSIQVDLWMSWCNMKRPWGEFTMMLQAILGAPEPGISTRGW
jgi:truncated hemoglobin YjbI